MIYIVTILGKFSRRTDATHSMDTSRIAAILTSRGHAVQALDVHNVIRLLEQRALPPASTFVIMGHPNPDIRAFVSDLADVLEAEGHRVVPSPIFIRAHENKGLQGLIALNRKLPFVPQTYGFDPDSVTANNAVVVKTVTGAGSSGVRRYADTDGIRRFLTAESLKRLPVARAARLFAMYVLRSWFANVKAADRFRSERPWTRYVLQEFVAGQESDYKVLVLGSKVYVAEREVRAKDFRASGSGKLSFPTPSAALLDLAVAARQLLQVPYISLDVLSTGDEFRIIEFQVVHFGPSVRDLARSVYARDGDAWVASTNSTTLEDDIALALHEFIAQQAKQGS